MMVITLQRDVCTWWLWLRQTVSDARHKAEVSSSPMAETTREQQFHQLINDHKKIIYKMVHLYADNAEDKSDLYQEILYQVWCSLPNFRGDAGLATWLYRVSLNTAFTFRRRDEGKKTITSLDKVDLPEEVPVVSENARKLHLAIGTLNDIEKAIITMHLDGYENEEIAGTMGISKNNVAVKLSRIRSRLTALLRHGFKQD